MIGNEFNSRGLEGYEATFFSYDTDYTFSDSYRQTEYEKMRSSSLDVLDSSYAKLTKQKTEFKTSLQKLEKTAKSDDEKKLVKLLKNQYSSFNLLMDNIKMVRNSDYTEKIDYNILHDYMVDKRELHEFLKTHEGFASKYNLLSIDNYEYLSKRNNSTFNGIDQDYNLLYLYV